MVTGVGLMFITCNKISLPLTNGLNDRATRMCVGLRVNGSTSPVVALQGVSSFPVMNCIDLPCIQMFDGAQIVKSSGSTLDASEIELADDACFRTSWVTGMVNC